MTRGTAEGEAEAKIAAAQRSGAKELNLGGLQLRELPSALRHLVRLQRLDIPNNHLTHLPEWLDQFPEMRTLDASANRLRALPETLGRLSQLEWLELSKNNLSSLPDSISQLEDLDSISLSSNKFDVIPEQLRTLQGLQTLEMLNCRLTAIPNWIEELRLLHTLILPFNQITTFPKTLTRISQLHTLDLSGNDLQEIPEWIAELGTLRSLALSRTGLTEFPLGVTRLATVDSLYLAGNHIVELPVEIAEMKELRRLVLGGERASPFLRMKDGNTGNRIATLPQTLLKLPKLRDLSLDGNPLNPELAAAYSQGLHAVKAYLRARAEGTVALNEAKLILIGEGEVGKSCLLDALRDSPWQEHDSTHGINIAPVNVTDPDSGAIITLNGWDFGGQRVYRPTHQLFFSSPAVYLLVWKPREGEQAGQVKEWIRLIKNRESDARIIVVGTHGGPRQRQPDIDKYEITQLFGDDTILGFHHVDNKPDSDGNRPHIAELREAIARVAIRLPDMGREVPTKWKRVRDELKKCTQPWISYEDFVRFCVDRTIAPEHVDLFAKLSHTLGHLIHYEYDVALRNIVILKPDWLATAISLVLDDPDTREDNGLVNFDRLRLLWDDPHRDPINRYPAELHSAFLRLMERFDLSYEVQLPQKDAPKTILISQLVPEARPTALPDWTDPPMDGDIEQIQICRIVDDHGQSVTPEGIFYRLIVRLHKYSLGRDNYHDSVHWQRGLMLDDDYNGRALLEHIENDIKITVRAAFPERFLAMLTGEVKWLVEYFWEGLRCDVMVPCITPCGMRENGRGLFEVKKLIVAKKEGRLEYPCDVSGCDKWHDIGGLLRNAAQIETPNLARSDHDTLRNTVETVLRSELQKKDKKDLHRFRHLSSELQRLMSQADIQFDHLMRTLTDEAKEGPRLFSFEAVEPNFFDRPNWITQKFRLSLWCEHARLPLSVLNSDGSNRGAYELTLTRDWVKNAAPYLKVLTTTLNLVLPVASSAASLLLEDNTYDRISKELDFGQRCADFFLDSGQKAGAWLGHGDSPAWEQGGPLRAEGAMLRELQELLKEKDPGFGGLVRVQNKQREFLWVHRQFVDQY